MNNIEWKDGAVCYANAWQWFAYGNDYLINKESRIRVFKSFASYSDFKLNEPRIGDYVEQSELDTEQKYNDTVEVFGLFGFPRWEGRNFYEFENKILLVDSDSDSDLTGQDDFYSECQRELSYNQLMAIGKLKRMMNERNENKPKEYTGVSKVNRDIERVIKDGNKYHRTIIGLDGTKTTIDVYRVLDAFNTGCAATDHAIKKMLCAGLRGHKNKLTDIDEAIESLQATKSLLIQKGGL